MRAFLVLAALATTSCGGGTACDDLAACCTAFCAELSADLQAQCSCEALEGQDEDACERGIDDVRAYEGDLPEECKL